MSEITQLTSQEKVEMFCSWYFTSIHFKTDINCEVEVDARFFATHLFEMTHVSLKMATVATKLGIKGF